MKLRGRRPWGWVGVGMSIRQLWILGLLRSGGMEVCAGGVLKTTLLCSGTAIAVEPLGRECEDWRRWWVGW